MTCINFSAQESSGTQGVLGPTKIYLAVQPPDNQSVQNINTSNNSTAQTVTKPVESNPQPLVTNNVSESSTTIKTEQVEQMLTYD